MATIKINVNGITNNVKPPLSKSKTNLSSAKSIISSINIPSDFKYASELKKIANTIDDSKTKIIEITKWTSEVVEKFEQAESKNMIVTNNMLSTKSESKINTNNSNIKTTVSTINKATNFAILTASNIISTGAKVINSYKTIFADNIKSAISATKAKIVKAFDTIINKAKSAFSTLVENIKSLANKVMAELNNVGAKIAQSFTVTQKIQINQQKASASGLKNDSTFIFNEDNIESSQFGGNQEVFYCKNSELLQDEKVQEIIRTYWPEADEEDIEMLLYVIEMTRMWIYSYG